MANRYWVAPGGVSTGTWDATTTTNWSTTSNGTGGASVPTSTDVAIFDSFSGAGVVTIGAASVPCSTLTLTGFTGTRSTVLTSRAMLTGISQQKQIDRVEHFSPLVYNFCINKI